MGTKTIGLREEVYERLRARKREDESFTDLVERLLSEARADWEEGFGTLPAAEADELEDVVATARTQVSAGLSARQVETLQELREPDDGTDEAA